MGKPEVTISAVMAFVLPWGLFLAALRLMAYWTPIGINPFEFANASDLLASALAGSAVTFAGIAISSIAGIKLGDSMPKWAGKPYMWTLAIVSLLGGLFAVAIDHPTKWFIGGLIFSLIITRPIIRNAQFRALFPSPAAAALAVMTCTYLPFMAYGTGAMDNRKALKPQSGVIVDQSRSALAIAAPGKLMYLGMLGEFTIFWDVESSATLVVPREAALVLQPTRSKPLLKLEDGR